MIRRELTDNSGNPQPHPFSSQLHTSDRIKLKVQMVIHLLIPKIEKNMHLFYLQWKIVKRKETVWVSLKKPESQTGRFITLTNSTNKK